MIRIMIADDEQAAASVMQQSLDGREGISVLAIAKNGEQAVDLARAHHPDLILMDIRMPLMDGITASQRIKAENPNIKIIILTLFAEPDDIMQSIQCKCDGYLMKGHRSEIIINSIKQAMSGLYVSDMTVMDKMQQRLERALPAPRDPVDLKILNNVEREIVRLITAGKKNAEIARELSYSDGYIRNQIASILLKLNLRNGKELAVWGFRMGL